MTDKQLEKALGTLVLYMTSERNFQRGRLVHLFDLPQGFEPKYRCCLIKTPRESKIIYQDQIYYAFPHFNKKIRLYNEQSVANNFTKYASATKQHASDKLR